VLKLLCVLLLLAPLGAGRVIALRFPRLETPLAQLVFVVAAAAAIAFVWWCYRREASYVAPRRKRVLAGLRTGAVVVILFICTGCFVELARSQDAKGRLLVLIDSSHSMSIADKRTQPDEIAAALTVVGGGSGDQAAKLTRSELVKAAFANKDIDLVTALGDRFSIEPYTFGQAQNLTPLELAPAGDRLAKLGAPAEAATQLGAALTDAAKRAKGRTLDGVVVITDGGWNRGEDPLAAAKALGVPVHTVGVGLPQSRDLEVAFVFCEDVVFKNDRFALEVRMRSRGYNGRSATLQVKRVDDKGGEEVVKEEPVDLGEGGEMVRSVEVLADREGVFTYVAELTPFPDEPNILNNRRAKSNVRVVDKKIQVLLIDDAPRWEFRFIRGILEADRQRLAPTFILRQGDEAAQGGKFLRHFPGTLAELRKYDAIILGDITADFFTGEELRVLEQWVRTDGGGLMVIAGRRSMPGAFTGTPLESLLPVESEAQPTWDVQDELTRSVTKGFRPELTAEGQRFSPLRFASEPGENERLWGEADAFYWYLPVKRLKSGATAYLVHPEKQLTDGTPMPILAGQRYGKGQVIYSASDESWRWRFHPGAAQHRRLWGQLIGSLSMAHLLGASSRTQLAVDKSEYGVGERATLVARVLDQDYNPLAADSVTVTVERELQREQVTLSARKDQPGVFAGEWVPASEGRFRLALAGTTPDDPGDERLVDVVSSRLELDDSGMRADLLRQVAQATSGTFVTLDKLPSLAEALKTSQKAGSIRREERTLWNAPGVMILLALFLGLEWFLRKRSDLL
jgi:hypothetical protein